MIHNGDFFSIIKDSQKLPIGANHQQKAQSIPFEPKPRTYVRGILPRMLRMSDSVGTHSIHGLTSGDLRRYFKYNRGDDT